MSFSQIPYIRGLQISFHEKNDTLKVIKKIERSRSILEVLKDTNGDTYYSKSFNVEIAKVQPEKNRLKSFVLNDFASIQFMSQLSQLSEYVPHFCSGKKENPSFVMSDVGPGQQLDEILLGGDYALAEKSLISLMKTLATIHKETIGKESQFLTIRDALGEPYEKDGGIDKQIFDYLNFLERISTYLNIEFVSHIIEKELREILDVVFKPKKLLGLTHWDPCPDNCMLVKDTVKLYDFERGCFSNVLIDGLYLSARFPSCWCFANIPQSIIDKAEKEYRNILSHKVPEISDDRYCICLIN